MILNFFFVLKPKFPGDVSKKHEKNIYKKELTTAFTQEGKMKNKKLTGKKKTTMLLKAFSSRWKLQVQVLYVN